MAYQVIKVKRSITGLKIREFVIDTASDVTNLPTNTKKGRAQTGDTVSDEMCAVGSTANCVATGDVYQLNASGTWVVNPALLPSGQTVSVVIDDTLENEGEAADAKAVGDALANKVNTSDLSNYATTASLAEYVKTSELPKGTTVADATSAEDVVQQLNALIASLKTAGIIATS